MAAPGIGERLRDARLARDLSLDDIEAGTRIRRRYLEALEAEAFDEIPGPAYVRGFLGAYAAYLGLPPDEIVALRPSVGTERILPRGAPGDLRITPAARGSRTRRIVTGAVVVLVVVGAAAAASLLYGELRQLAETSAPGSLPRAASSEKSRGLLSALAHALIPPAGVSSGRRGVEPRSGAGTTRPSAASVAAAPAATPQPSGSSLSGAPRSGQAAARTATGGGTAKKPPSAAPGPPYPGGPGPAAPSQPRGSAVPAATTPAQAAAPQAPGGPLTSPLRVVLVVTDRSWIRTVADGITVFEGFLSAGDQQAWQAKNQLSLKIGNASAVHVTVNGRSLGRLGNPGDVVDETFTVGGPVGR